MFNEREKQPFDITPAHLIFINEYILHGNKTQAYKKAFPNACHSTANREGSRISLIPEIAELIEDAQEKLAIKFDVGKDAMIRRLLNTANKCEEKENYTVHIKYLQEINRIVGNLAKTQVEHSGTLPITINLNLDSDVDDTETSEDGK